MVQNYDAKIWAICLKTDQTLNLHTHTGCMSINERAAQNQFLWVPGL